jgi:hypothetical protein
VLFGSGVSFAGVMAFIFSDLVVFPMLRISARYFGWKMAAYILAVFLVSLVITALTLHFTFDLLEILPDSKNAKVTQTKPAERFNVDYTLVLNGLGIFGSVAFFWLASHKGGRKDASHDHHDKSSGHGGAGTLKNVSLWVAIASIIWISGGLVVWLLTGSPA